MPPKSTSGLPPRMRAFVGHFVACRNGAQAAREAGYSEDNAKQTAYRLLQRADVLAAIRKHEEGDERLRGEVGRKVRNTYWELIEHGKSYEPVLDKRGKKRGRRMADTAAVVNALREVGKLEGLYPREGIEVKVQGAVEDLLDGVRPLVSPQAYAELVLALAEISGVSRVAAQAAAGDRGEPVH